MRKHIISSTLVVILAVAVGYAKDKSKNILPEYVLRAQTVAIVIDPQAGISLNDPNANQQAQRDVEAAFLKWGRLRPQIGITGADLIVVVRRGHGKLAEQTVKYPRQNDRLGSITSTDNAWSVGAQQGRPPQSQAPSREPLGGRTQPQTEVGNTEDSFQVFRGDLDHPLDSPPVWRYSAKNGLHSPDVPAVEEFRKAMIEAEKAAAKKP